MPVTFEGSPFPSPFGGEVLGGQGPRADYGGGGQQVSPAYSEQPIETGVGQATRFNLSGETGIADITNLINSLNRQATTAAEQARIPNAPALEQASSANIGSELRGQLPSDVLRNIRQQMAEAGVARGTSGSPAQEADLLRVMGLTSLDLTGRGQQELSAAYARNPAAPIFNPAEMLITPYQGAQLGLQAGQLGLSQQTEADRMRMEAAQLGARGVGGGGGRGGGGGYSMAPSTASASPYYGSYAADSGYTPSYWWDPRSGEAANQAAWYASIGYNPMTGAQTAPAGGGGTMTINGQQIDLSTGQPVSSFIPPGFGQSVEDYMYGTSTPGLGHSYSPIDLIPPTGLEQTPGFSYSYPEGAPTVGSAAAMDFGS